MELREACQIISRASGAPDVIRWAAHLRKAKLLPKTGLTGNDIARLLVAIAASPDPRNAVDILIYVMDLTTIPPAGNGTRARMSAVWPFADAIMGLSTDVTTSLALELLYRQFGSSGCEKPYELSIITAGQAVRVVQSSPFDNSPTEKRWGIWPDNPVGARITGTLLNDIAAAIEADTMIARPYTAIETHTIH